MTKKKAATNQPVVAEEPARPEEQFRVEQSEVAPPSARPVGPRSNVTGSGMKSYGARSAAERRAGGRSTASARRSTSSRPARRSEHGPRPEIVANMLEHPTITVTEDQLRQEYGFVVNDLRSMGLTAIGLIVALAVLATVLPK
jgi:hypothetical protein